MVGDLNQPDGILVVHVGAQEIHLLVGLPDFRVQLFHLPLKSWGGTTWGREAVKRADVWDFLQRTFPEGPENLAAPDRWTGIWAEVRPHELQGGKN